MGENGAGKSTLMKCLFGMYSKDSGTIELEGKEVSFKNSKEALESGVAMVHQELNQALKRNVMDNIWLGRYPKIGGLMVNEKKIYQDTLDVFKELEIDVDPKRIMSTMPVSQRQMVEIAKAVSFQSKVIVFDEPTSSLTEEEVEHLFRIINMLRDRGVGIIYISHKMAEIKRISDEITIMRDGTWVTTKPADELSMDDIIRLMVGRELTNQFPPKTNKPGEVALEVEHLTAQYSLLKDVSFTARKGEILGIAGLDGSGRTETLENIFGIATRKDGVIKLAPRAGIQLDESASPAEKLKAVQKLMAEDDPRAAKVYESIGCYLGHTLAYYYQTYGFRYVLLLGRVMSGKGGDILMETCDRVLKDEYPEIADKFQLKLPDEYFRRVGQSMAVASLPQIG